METRTTPLEIVYNRKYRFDITDVPQEINTDTPIRKFKKWFTQFFIELEKWGYAAGDAIRK
ncbi:hypothetical protein [uncultured Aquimarina sp.]|uniref:hypothetical protein n=1 Tax=uncultured Aquimarina sp. TaxID=575652 RepID=UPI002624E917|nr:hypothetical protein [uncultured Aquimarina sp.]